MDEDRLTPSELKRLGDAASPPFKAPDRSAEADMLLRVLADGGYPRAVVTLSGTVWLGYDGRRWVGPRPTPARPVKASRAA